jgi:predicted phosphodiesterase
MMKKRYLLSLIFSAVFFSMVFAGSFGKQPKPEVKKGPYLSWDGDPKTSMTVSWETSVPTAGQLAYGPKGKMNYILRDEQTGELHHIRIRDLKSDTRYYYQILNVDAPVCSFKTAPKDQRDFKFAIYGDTRTFPEEHKKVIAALIRYDPEFLIHTGDYIQDGRIWKLWQEFFDASRPFSAAIPLFTVIGNHERTYDNYVKLFALPGNERWYSFDYPNTHFIMLNTEEDFSAGSPQYQWLEAELKESRPKYQWLFVIQHRQTFSSGKRGSDKDVLKYLEPLFRKYRPDAVFCGHEHFYERQRQSGVNYIITGGGGAPLYEVNPGDSTFHAESSLHYCQVEISDKAAKVRMVRLDGTTPDSLVIIK